MALLTAFCVGGTGCMSIFFHNGGGTTNEDVKRDHLHHIAAFNLIEISSPLDLGDECPSGWDTLKTERGPLPILIGMLTQPFYGPMTIGAQCK